MSGVDSRIVTMKFDNSTFEQAAATTMSTMDKLKSALGFSGASKGLDEVQASANKMNFGSMEGGITNVSAKFVALGDRRHYGSVQHRLQGNVRWYAGREVSYDRPDQGRL